MKKLAKNEITISYFLNFNAIIIEETKVISYLFDLIFIYPFNPKAFLLHKCNE